METATTKPLGKSDAATISELDKLSGFHVLEWVEDFSGWNDESWGLYLGGKLIGYCTIGYADNECPVITGSSPTVTVPWNTFNSVPFSSTQVTVYFTSSKSLSSPVRMR